AFRHAPRGRRVRKRAQGRSCWAGASLETCGISSGETFVVADGTYRRCQRCVGQSRRESQGRGLDAASGPGLYLTPDASGVRYSLAATLLDDHESLLLEDRPRRVRLQVGDGGPGISVLRVFYDGDRIDDRGMGVVGEDADHLHPIVGCGVGLID